MATVTWMFLQALPFVLIIIIFVKVISLLKNRQKLVASFKNFPGPKPHWLWGNMQELTGDFQGMLRVADYAAKYHGAFPVWMGPTDAFLMTVHPATVRSVLSGTDPKDEFSYSLMRPWIGDGLLLSSGKKWDRNRRMLTPAFHQEVIRNYVKIFYQSAQELLKKWEGVKEPVETFHHISLLTLDSMMKCLFGYTSHCQNERVRHPYIQGVYDVSEQIVKRITNPLHHFQFIYDLSANGKEFRKTCDIIHEHSEKIIRDRRQLIATEKPGSRPIDFLDILLSGRDSDGNGLSDQEIRDEVDTFMFEGHDSTASSMSWCLYNLAKHQDCQDKCREEIQQQWGDKEDITWEDLNKLEYTFMCVKESMRMYPPVPNVSRCAEKDIKLPDGRIIPKGVRMAVSLFALHRNPEVWPEPEEYDPSRFSQDSMIYQSAYMPFSIGPRNCIGQLFAVTQIKVIIPTLIRKFRFTLDPSRPAEPESMLILRSKNGLYLNINPV
ncbi:cytochrome P450 4F12-like [Saccostrea echinata]|uniref:cytochrome P450 4F12-like n=1 Tax=Saccostrea echinata TaxID=191078 RepID=UPI002A7FCA34|nr:cytochrome P450 4F12-like [Saccostrea echinata]